MIKKFFIALLSAPLLSGIFLSIHLSFLYREQTTSPVSSFSILSGDTFKDVNNRLVSQNIIQYPRLFHWLARFKGTTEKLRIGEYALPEKISMLELHELLFFGKPTLKKITIPEGKNIFEVAKILADAGFGEVEENIALARNDEFAQSLGLNARTLEGYLYPETYKFNPGQKVREIYINMVSLFNQKAKTELAGHPFLNEHEVVILASIVEKETGAKHERPLIASVFTNRLKKKMRLQSDPTTIYGIWERYEGNIRKQDLLEETPYNTYKIPSLPIGPIANPSLEAIKAVKQPASSPYLYFVSKNDGTHIFSETYAKHNEAVREWQMNRKNRSGKSWRNLKQKQ
jgi:UPF0755 protein